MDKKRMKMIDRDARRDDSHLPFKIGKPKRHVCRDIYYECHYCGFGVFISKYTVMYVCKGCGKLERVNEE